jgi:hypothetical protein
MRWRIAFRFSALTIPRYCLAVPYLSANQVRNGFQSRHGGAVAIDCLVAERKAFAVTLFEIPLRLPLCGSMRCGQKCRHVSKPYPSSGERLNGRPVARRARPGACYEASINGYVTSTARRVLSSGVQLATGVPSGLLAGGSTYEENNCRLIGFTVLANGLEPS